MTGSLNPAPNPEFEREKWAAEVRLRERELDIKEKEVQAEIQEQRRSRWANPLVLAVLAAAVAAAGNAWVAWYNGSAQRDLEDRRSKAQLDLERYKADAQNRLEQNKVLGQQTVEEAKAEAARILEVIKTADPDKAAVNLKFLVDTGLIADEQRQKKLSAFLAQRQPGEGPALPTITGRGALEEVASFGAETLYRRVANQVGIIGTTMNGAKPGRCNAFALAADLILTASYCVENFSDKATFVGADGISRTLQLPPVEVGSPLKTIQAAPTSWKLSYALLRATPPLSAPAPLFQTRHPVMGEAVFIVQYSGFTSNNPTVMVSRAACRVTNVSAPDAVSYRCLTIPGSAGAPVISEKDGALLGLHLAGSSEGQDTYDTGHGIRLAAVTTGPQLRRLLEVRTDPLP